MEKIVFLKLIDNYLDGTASPAEKGLLEEYYKRLEASGNTELSPEQEEVLKAAMYEKIRRRMERATVPVIPMRRKIFLRVAAIAASVLLLAGAYWMFIYNSKKEENIVAQNENRSSSEILPGKNAAILVFDSGKQIILDSAAGMISKEDGATIVNTNGTVTYSSTNDEDEIAWHTISTARGNQYQLVLADGSKVYLNSASSLRFPSSFTGATREVELTSGEAYFDIANNTAQPFHVKTKEMTVQVTGTHFNINAYSDEGPVATTLVEGKVSVNRNKQVVNIKPGQQAVFSNDKFLITQPDINKVIAWRTGFFDFDNMDITAIMKQISRWYDVDVVYEGKITTEKFGGRISRLLPLSKVLKLLEENDVKFNVEGKRVIIK